MSLEGQQVIMHPMVMPNLDNALRMFSGRKEENFSLFLKNFEKVAKEYGWSDNAKSIWMVSRLSGRARKIWESLDDDEYEGDDEFERQLNKFKKYFGKTDDFASTITLQEVKIDEADELIDVKTKIENSVKAYLKNKTNVSTAEGKQIFDKMAWEQLFKASPKVWKEKIIRSGVQTFEEAIKTLEYEREVARKLDEVNDEGENKEISLEAILMEKDKKIALLEESLNAIRVGDRRSINVRQNSYLPQKFCSFCKLNGHSKWECRRLNNERNRSYGNFKSRNHQNQGVRKPNFLG